MSLPLLLALVAPAQAQDVYTSELQSFTLMDSVNVFRKTEFDTGWLPADSPVAVRFQIRGEGASGIVMEGDADLWWPDDLNLGFFPTPGTGELVADTGMAAVVTTKFDIFGYSWEQEIFNEGFDVYGEKEFNPFVLWDSDPNRIEIADAIASTLNLIDFELDVFAGVSFYFTTDVTPRAIIGFEGGGFELGEYTLSSEDEVYTFPADGQPEAVVRATYLGLWDSALGVDFRPTLGVDAGFLGSYDIISFDVPIDLITSSFEQPFPTLNMAFPLPLLNTDYDSYDFGELTVGELQNLEFPIYNDGLLDLEGDAAISGSGYFSSYPNYFLAGPGREDGLVVSFAPETAGSFEATLLLISNDPNTPHKEIRLTGVAVDPPVIDDGNGGGDGDDGDAGDPTLSTEVKGCGCTSTRQSGGAPLLGLLGLGLVALARRRRSGARESDAAR